LDKERGSLWWTRSWRLLWVFIFLSERLTYGYQVYNDWRAVYFTVTMTPLTGRWTKRKRHVSCRCWVLNLSWLAMRGFGVRFYFDWWISRRMLLHLQSHGKRMKICICRWAFESCLPRFTLIVNLMWRLYYQQEEGESFFFFLGEILYFLFLKRRGVIDWRERRGCLSIVLYGVVWFFCKNIF
jgi:hypothetical protein